MKLIEFRPEGHTITLDIMGKKWEGITYRWQGRDTMYLVGELPKAWTHEHRCRFRINYKYWYVVAYMDHFDDLSEQVKTLNPFGNDWILVQKDGPVLPVVVGHIQ
jgi:hypothetical protein